MIVTCPSCEAKYRVDAAALAARGNKVKCAACAHSWVVEDEGLTLNEPVEPSFDVSEAAPEPTDADFEDDPAPSIREKPAAAVRARAEQQRRKQAMAVEGAGWAGVAACVAVALISAVIFRVNIVQTWPRTAGAYAAVGMDINPYGLEVGMLTASFEDGGLYVEGVLENITGGERPTVPLNARVLDSHGAVLNSWPVQLESAVLPGGGAERFYTSLDTVPESAVRVEVIIAEEGVADLADAQAHEGETHAAPTSHETPAAEGEHGSSDHGQPSAEPHASEHH
ncbi:zinc-ribbon domain-containing protein [Oceanicaulis sp. UBA2681]|uniref:zinc-ribbon domain-containing protein n=1 Tax=Oceanicaulis sp. UBA2681 TaxID=1947007 RepID=UPI00257AAEEB|nr:zinc-ribbon domain-containing protein [Oceanicaulis sp. UBA2681]|tara:strand:+ start:958 stop:1803 length:846 start_codon:yes stop_codon:yes gene_type:complete